MRLVLKLCPLVVALVLASCGTVGQRWGGVDNFDQVTPTLYRGAQPTAEGYRRLAAYGVRTVINLRDSDDRREAQWAHDAGMAYVRLPLDAETVTPADAERFLTLLGEARGPVFVHCLQGRDRTGMAVAAYRVRMQGWTLEAALEDLNAHGYHWALYPKVRAAIRSLANGTAPVEVRTLTADAGRATQAVTARN